MKHKLTLNKKKYQLGSDDEDQERNNMIGSTIGNIGGVAGGVISQGYKADYGDTGNAISAGVDVGINAVSAFNPVIGGVLKLGKGIFDGIKGNQQRKTEEAKQKMIEQGMRERDSIAKGRANANPNASGNRLTTIYQLGGLQEEMMPQQGGEAIPLNNSGDVLYQGNQHSEGGIKLPNAEVENGEVAVNTPEGTMIKSDILIDPMDEQKRTFAEIAQENSMKKGMYQKKLLKLQDKIGKKEFISSEDNGSIKVMEEAIVGIDTIQQEAAQRQEQIKQETQQVDANSPEAQVGLRNGGQRMEFNNVQQGQEFTGEGMQSPTLMQLGTQEDGYVDIKDTRIMNPGETMTVPNGVNKVIEQKMALGGMLKRKDGSYSQRGLWDNIRANKGSGKEPTKEMLKQEKKINNMQTGGEMVKGYGKFLRQTKRQELRLAGDRSERKNIRDKYSILNTYRPDKSGMSNEDYANLQTKLGMMTTKDSMSNANQVDMIDNDIKYQLGSKMKYQTGDTKDFEDYMYDLKERGKSITAPNERGKFYNTEIQKSGKYKDYSTWNKQAVDYSSTNKRLDGKNYTNAGTANQNWNSFQDKSRTFVDEFERANKTTPQVQEAGVKEEPTLVDGRSNVAPLTPKGFTQPNNIGQPIPDKTKGNGLLNLAANADIIAGAFNLGRDKNPPYKDTTGYINPALEQYNTTPINETYRSTRKALQNNSAQNQNLQLMGLASKQSKDLMSEVGGVNNRNIDRRNNAQSQNINIEAGNNQTMYDNQANQVKFKNDRNAKLQQLASQVSGRSQSMIRDNNANKLANKQLDLYNGYFNGTTPANGTTETKPTLGSQISTGINNRNQNYVNNNMMNNQIPNIQVPQININNPNVGMNNNIDPYAIQGNVNEYGVPNSWRNQKGGKLQKGSKLLKLGSLC
jgi:hypothetical protein